MSGRRPPRVVVVRRRTEYEQLLATHGTRGQAEFFLQTHNLEMSGIERRHTDVSSATTIVLDSVPLEWRQVTVLRDDLDRFLFHDDDIVVVVGQDGLVANTAKYLDGQPTIGVNPDPSLYEGVLVRHQSHSVRALLSALAEEAAEVEHRTMVSCVLDDGRSLTALNEIFVGHRSHQSARYQLTFDGKSEDHSSSGVIVSTGTGASGWTRSIHRQVHSALRLPTPTDRKLTFFAREPWPSVATGANLTEGLISPAEQLTLSSRMEQGGVIFGDGMEQDSLTFDWGVTATLVAAKRRLHLVIS